MGGFSAGFAGLDEGQRWERYRRLAAAALEHRELGSAEHAFLGHNAGVAYRVETAGGGPFVLKIAEPISEGGGWATDGLEAVLAWLAALARETDLVVQEPVPNRDGGLLTEVAFDDLAEPFHCSLQRWVEGERVGHLTPDHARRIGAAVARLHRHGATWVPPAPLAADDWEPGWVSERAGDLRGVVDLGVLPLYLVPMKPGSAVHHRRAVGCSRVTTLYDIASHGLEGCGADDARSVGRARS